MSKTSVAVVGATGYGGAELVRLLSNHPCARVTSVTSSRSGGKRLDEECPWLSTDLVLREPDLDFIDAEIYFFCQESGYAMERAASVLGKGKVIDLSADYRLRDKAVYEEFYKISHKDSQREAVYGLPELSDRSAIEAANLVANPGCYPTASLLALMPLVNEGLVKSLPVIDAKSGVSGAGRSRKETEYLFSELDNGFKAYGVRSHRHTPEIEQMAGTKVRFTPHLLPLPRGIHATLYVEMAPGVDLFDLYKNAYHGEPFVKIQSKEPNTKQVLGSNTCVIAPFYDERTECAIVCSVIDNLVKGAAGQAIQNMNLMLGIPETTGLPQSGMWP